MRKAIIIIIIMRMAIDPTNITIAQETNTHLLALSRERAEAIAITICRGSCDAFTCMRAHSCGVLRSANTKAAARLTVFLQFSPTASLDDFEKCVFIVQLHFISISFFSLLCSNEISCDNKRKNKIGNDFASCMCCCGSGGGGSKGPFLIAKEIKFSFN